MPEVRQLIYVTNRTIGAAADDLKRSLRRDKDIYLDVRDSSWFIERELSAPQREAASIELAQRIVEPLLIERRIRQHFAPALTNDEARLALLHLTLDAEDQASDKGLTKRCFESLVLAAVHDSEPEIRLTKGAIASRVARLLPAGFEMQIEQQVAGALQRLSVRNGPIKQHGKTDEYFLSFEQREEVKRKTTEYLRFQGELESKLVSALQAAVPEVTLDDEQLAAVGSDLRLGLETVLLRRGEVFAAAVKTGQSEQVDAQEIVSIIGQMKRSTGATLTVEQIAVAIIEVLERPSASVRRYLHRLADAYTVFAFLRQTPDVQKVVLSMFSGGELWLDTTIILPLFAEVLLDDPSDRYYHALIRAAKDAGLRLYATDGVVEEVERHVNRCVAFARIGPGTWRSRVPFLSTAYALSGRARASFADWVERFRGTAEPEEDIREYLYDMHGIERRNLLKESEEAPSDLRAAVQEVWYQAHERRRKAAGEEDLDPAIKQKLVAHDVENTVGIMQLRKQARANPLGYRAWWLTLDSIALSLGPELQKIMTTAPPANPTISPDFMSQYLRIGPLRTAIERELWAGLPILTDITRYDFLPTELVAIADEVRESHSELEEGVIRRRVRDALNKAKVQRGPEALGGAARMKEAIAKRLGDQVARSKR